MHTLPIALAARHRDVAPGPRPTPPLVQPTPTWPLASGGTVMAPLTTTQLAGALGQLLRHDEFLLAVLLDRPAANLTLTARRALDRAARAPLGVVVDAVPADPRRAPLTAALRLIAATMRSRSAAAWRAIDELERQRGNAERAARELSCTGPTIRRHRQRSHHAATDDLPTLLEALLRSPEASGFEAT